MRVRMVGGPRTGRPPKSVLVAVGVPLASVKVVGVANFQTAGMAAAATPVWRWVVVDLLTRRGRVSVSVLVVSMPSGFVMVRMRVVGLRVRVRVEREGKVWLNWMRVEKMGRVWVVPGMGMMSGGCSRGEVLVVISLEEDVSVLAGAVEMFEEDGVPAVVVIVCKEEDAVAAGEKLELEEKDGEAQGGATALKLGTSAGLPLATSSSSSVPFTVKFRKK